MLVGSQSAHTGSGPDLFISRSLSSKLWREGRWSHGGSERQTEEVSPAVSEDINRDKTGLGWRCHLLASQDAVTLLPRQIVQPHTHRRRRGGHLTWRRLCVSTPYIAHVNPTQFVSPINFWHQIKTSPKIWGTSLNSILRKSEFSMRFVIRLVPCWSLAGPVWISWIIWHEIRYIPVVLILIDVSLH